MERRCTLLSKTSITTLVTDSLETSPVDAIRADLQQHFGGITSNLQYSWIAVGAKLEIVDVRTGNRQASWNFGIVLRGHRARITCVAELYDTGTGGVPNFLVGLSYEPNGGMVCVFDPVDCKIVRAILVDQMVSTVHVISVSSKQNECNNPIGFFETIDGIVAVGTFGGNTYVVDLCREKWLDQSTVCNESNPSRLLLPACEGLTKSEFKRYKALAEQQQCHLALQINDLGFSERCFTLLAPNGKEAFQYPRTKVKVTAILYIPKLMSLLVGYSFGAWQIYNLLTLELSYTSPLYDEFVPISHFAFQEPSDDPRAFCYIWAVYSNSPSAKELSVPLAAMYALSYESKETIPNYGTLYQKLNGCCLKFQMDLLPSLNLNEDIPTGYCISLQPYYSLNTMNANDSILDERYTLCSIVWANRFDDHRRHQVNMAIVDLDQWYKDQMPPTLRDNDIFVACFELTVFLPANDVIPQDVKIDSNTISSFMAVQRLEEHYYPSALAFDFWCLQKKSILSIRNYGVQRALLLKMENTGVECFLNAETFTKQCLESGIQPLSGDLTPRERPNACHQLLSIALEYNLIDLLNNCAEKWATGAYSVAGCTLGLFVDWANERSQFLQEKANDLCVSLFDYSDVGLDSNTRRIFDQCVKQIHHLAIIFQKIITKCGEYLNKEAVSEIKDKLQALHMFSAYLEVLQWLLNIGLLPESPPDSFTNEGTVDSEHFRVPYPAKQLIEYYQKKRQEIGCSLGQPSKYLYIDCFIENECGGTVVHQEWARDSNENNGLYPPSSLQALLRTYFIENVPVQAKHILLHYFFMDLALVLEHNNFKSVIANLLNFSSISRLPSYEIKMVQAFWQIDHGDIEKGMDLLMDPLIGGTAVNSFKPWQHSTVLNILLNNERFIKYGELYVNIRQPLFNSDDEICTAIKVFLASDRLHSAFEFQRRHQTTHNKRKILECFIRGCCERRLLNKLLDFNLSIDEEEMLLEILNSRSENNELHLIQYYLERGRGYDALDKLKSKWNVEPNRLGIGGQEGTKIGDVILDAYVKTLPNISKSIFSNFKSEKYINYMEVFEPRPLSVEVRSLDKFNVTETVNKIRETWSSKTLDNIKKSRTQLMPLLRDPNFIEPIRVSSTSITYPKIIYQQSTRKRYLADNNDHEVDQNPAKRVRLATKEEDVSATERLRRTPIVTRRSRQSSLTSDTPKTSLIHGILKSEQFNSSLGSTRTSVVRFQTSNASTSYSSSEFNLTADSQYEDIFITPPSPSNSEITTMEEQTPKTKERDEMKSILKKLNSNRNGDSPYKTVKPRKSLQRTVLEGTLVKNITPVLFSKYNLRSSTSQTKEEVDYTTSTPTVDELSRKTSHILNSEMENITSNSNVSDVVVEEKDISTSYESGTDSISTEDISKTDHTKTSKIESRAETIDSNDNKMNIDLPDTEITESLIKSSQEIESSNNYIKTHTNNYLKITEEISFKDDYTFNATFKQSDDVIQEREEDVAPISSEEITLEKTDEDFWKTVGEKIKIQKIESLDPVNEYGTFLLNKEESIHEEMQEEITIEEVQEEVVELEDITNTMGVHVEEGDSSDDYNSIDSVPSRVSEEESDGEEGIKLYLEEEDIMEDDKSDSSKDDTSNESEENSSKEDEDNKVIEISSDSEDEESVEEKEMKETNALSDDKESSSSEELVIEEQSDSEESANEENEFQDEKITENVDLEGIEHSDSDEGSIKEEKELEDKEKSLEDVYCEEIEHLNSVDEEKELADKEKQSLVEEMEQFAEERSQNKEEIEHEKDLDEEITPLENTAVEEVEYSKEFVSLEKENLIIPPTLECTTNDQSEICEAESTHNTTRQTDPVLTQGDEIDVYADLENVSPDVVPNSLELNIVGSDVSYLIDDSENSLQKSISENAATFLVEEKSDSIDNVEIMETPDTATVDKIDTPMDTELTDETRSESIISGINLCSDMPKKQQKVKMDQEMKFVTTRSRTRRSSVTCSDSVPFVETSEKRLRRATSVTSDQNIENVTKSRRSLSQNDLSEKSAPRSRRGKTPIEENPTTLEEDNLSTSSRRSTRSKQSLLDEEGSVTSSRRSQRTPSKSQPEKALTPKKERDNKKSTLRKEDLLQIYTDKRRLTRTQKIRMESIYMIPEEKSSSEDENVQSTTRTDTSPTKDVANEVIPTPKRWTRSQSQSSLPPVTPDVKTPVSSRAGSVDVDLQAKFTPEVKTPVASRAGSVDVDLQAKFNTVNLTPLRRSSRRLSQSSVNTPEQEVLSDTDSVVSKVSTRSKEGADKRSASKSSLTVASPAVEKTPKRKSTFTTISEETSEGPSPAKRTKTKDATSAEDHSLESKEAAKKPIKKTVAVAKRTSRNSRSTKK